MLKRKRAEPVVQRNAQDARVFAQHMSAQAARHPRRLFERIRIKNYNAAAVTLTVRLAFGTDFADIFEVRGLKRATRGRLARPKADRRSAVFAYAGEDGVFRETRIAFELEPAEVFHEILEHRWFLSEKAGKDVGTTAAAKSYVEKILPATPSTLTVLPFPTPDTLLD